jgi:hypothetical protein
MVEGAAATAAAVEEQHTTHPSSTEQQEWLDDFSHHIKLQAVLGRHDKSLPADAPLATCQSSALGHSWATQQQCTGINICC